MNIIRKNNQTSYTNRNNREKFKEDIKLMSEEEKRNNHNKEPNKNNNNNIKL